MSDVDLLRRVMLLLEERQRSPRQVVVVSLAAESEMLGSTVEAIAAAMSRLLAIDYIDGPGFDQTGFFLFRKLTRRGTEFVQAARRPGDWSKLKQRYAAGAADM